MALQRRGDNVQRRLVAAAATAAAARLGGDLYTTLREGARRRLQRYRGQSSGSRSASSSMKRSRSSSSSSRVLKKFKRGSDRVGGYFGRYALAIGEKKFFDGTNTLGTVSSTGAIAEDSLNHITQGVTEQARVGRLAKIHSLHINGIFELPLSTALAAMGDAIRFIVYIDKQCNGATAATTDILEGATPDFLDFRNLANSHRFFILMDKRVSLVMPTNTVLAGPVYATGRVIKSFTFNKHFKDPLPIEFNATTGAITEIRSNNIGVMAISLTGKCELSFQWRVRFTD